MPVDKQHEKLLDHFRSAPSEDRALVQLLSIVYAPLSKGLLLTILRRAGLTAPGGKEYTGVILSESLDRLAERHLLLVARDGVRCDARLMHTACLSAVADGVFHKMAQAVRIEIPLDTDWGNSYYRSALHALRDLRIAFYLKDEQFAFETEARFRRQFPYDLARCHPFVTVCTGWGPTSKAPAPMSFDETWFRALPQRLQHAALHEILAHSSADLAPAQGAFQVLADLAARASMPQPLYDTLCIELVLRGRIDEAEKATREQVSSTEVAVSAWIMLLKGRSQDAADRFEAALALFRKETGKRKTFLDDITGPFFILALIGAGTEDALARASEYCAFVTGKKEWPWRECYLVLKQVLLERSGERSSASFLDTLSLAPAFETSPLYALFSVLSLNWCGSDRARERAEHLVPLAERALEAGYLWLAEEMRQAARACRVSVPKPERHSAGKGLVPLSEIVQKVEFWQTALKALIRLNVPEEEVPEKPQQQSRLVWHFEELRGYFEIHPREQKQTPAGKWSAGRNVALKRLAEESSTIEFLTAQDRQIAGCIKLERGQGYYGRDSYQLNQDQALPLMVGHPHVYLDAAASVRLEIVRGEPEIQLTTEGENLSLSMFPPFGPQQKIYLQKESPTRIKVYEAKDEYRKIAAILGDGLTIPARAKDEVLAAIHSLSSVLTVHSDVGDASAEPVPGDSTPWFHLLPYQAGLKLELLVRPFSDAGPWFRPGVGGETVIATLDGKKMQARRDLRHEVRRCADLLSLLPQLQEGDDVEGTWFAPDTEMALELLHQLQSLSDTVRVAWPEGARFRIKQTLTPKNLKVTVRKSKEYFELEGEVRLDQGLVLDLQKLVELAKGTQGRFVKLEDGDFLALSSQLKKYLDDLASCTDPHGKAFRFHPLASPLFEELAAGCGVFEADPQWQQQLKRLREAEAHQPQVPTTLQAELRGYQVEGFSWLNRLAHWSVGACLADDMGLGKTVQALAQILTMAGNGPSLVVAPTSVCLNWESETRRFAPTLNPIVFGGPDRAGLLKKLQPFDLVICSYGLLQQEGELLAAVGWQAIVLDEAQAIKNMATKRSQAAMALSGAFRMVATGTPIENHLGELWNVFRFINPGLLGSLKQFNVRFASPIEKGEDKKARARLKKLIQPFILRRTKSQVLEELPPRTEITVTVEMGPEEAALYEAVRKSAVENLAGIGKVEGKGELHLKILAEIMRLRRACCHPRLVLPESAVAGSKLAAFAEIVEELRDNRHKALVFSQFVGHLEIIREYVESAGIPYQYLDGSTPPLERKRRVDAFQEGSGDLFLISLKAGGVGLNLTAADYVIHMDPWWNPAVEDQASDRAHRIGQQRPVTIYRIVSRGTIEEKIVALHQQKRGLADGLLEESDLSGKVSADELLTLLRNDTSR